MLNKIDISIVIVSYNVKEFVRKCLQSLLEYIDQTIAIEVVLVDNNSTDKTVELVKKEFPQVNIIKNITNKGFPSANNQAFKLCKGEYILMLNPDAEIIDGSFNKLFYYLNNNPDISIIGPKILNTDRSFQQCIWRFPTIKRIFAESFYLKFLIKNQYYKEKDFNQIFDVDSVSGSALMFRKNLIDKIGMLDENLFWIEDVDFCYKAKQKNCRIVYYPEAKVVHHSGKSVIKNYNVAYFNKIFNFIKYYKKHHSAFQYYVVWFISFIQVIYKVLLFWVLAPFKNIYFKKAKAYLFTLKFFFVK